MIGRTYIHIDQETFDDIVDGYPGPWVPRWFRVWFTKTLFRVAECNRRDHE